MVTEVNSASGTSSSVVSSTSASAALSADFDTFITLLTSQVTNQDPLSPLDSTQFVDQLATFSGLEQQIASNAHLESIVTLLQSSLGQGGDLLQKTVTASSITANGAFNERAVVASGVERGALIVTNAAGEEIYRGPLGTQWSWNGRTSDGLPVDQDTYSFSIETSAGRTEAAMLGTVDRVITTGSGQDVGLGDGITSSRYNVVNSSS